jgi:hypothetical protein
MPIPASDRTVTKLIAALQPGWESRTRLILTACGLLWLCGVSAGLAWLAAYDNGPGSPPMRRRSGRPGVASYAIRRVRCS